MHAGYETKGVYTDAFLARPAAGTGHPGVVLLSGMGGMTWTQREITRHFARAGFVAISPDYMGASLPGHADRLRAKNSLDVESATKQIIGAADFLRSLPWVGPKGRVGILGFCLGGGLAILAAARSREFASTVIYHHSLFPDERELDSLDCPLQYHIGTNDHSTPKDEIDAFSAAMAARGKTFELHWYKDMEHSFAQIAPDAKVSAPRRAATDLSYDRSFAFFHRTLGRKPKKAGKAARRKSPAKTRAKKAR
jgi:carboxymethylenebutenolidase